MSFVHSNPTPAFVLAALSVLFASTWDARAVEVVPGPVDVDVVRVIDGDSFVAEARIWPGQRITVGVRIRGVDAPEMRSRCVAEKAAAQRSRSVLKRLLAGGHVRIANIGGGKFYGRVLADVVTGEGRAVAPTLIAEAAARAYDGGRREAYCD